MTFNEAGKLNFPGPIGTKRRRMRSGGNVSTLSNNLPHESPDENVSEQKTTQTSKCKGATTIPIFLKKTYKMVDTCDPSIASWTEDGEMFVVKDPDVFAAQIIPQYFDHNKFSSFARQLNFYGFRKMQSKPIRNSDFDAETAKHVTFFNENFKRGRCDLLKKIQRSTRGGGNGPPDHTREIQLLRDQVANCEQRMSEMETQYEERVRRLELDMLARMEQMMLAVQQQQSAQMSLEKATSVGTNSNSSTPKIQQPQPQSQPSLPPPIQHQQPQQHQQTPQHQQLQLPEQQMRSQHQQQINSNQQISYGVGGSAAGNNMDFGGFSFSRNNPVASSASNGASASPFQQQQMRNGTNKPSGPTLPPHPKQKMLPMGGMPGMMGAPPDRMSSLRGISALSRGFSGLSRGASVESTGLFDENLFNMLMMGDNEGNQAPNGGEAVLSPTPISDQGQHGMMTQHQGMYNNINAPVTVSEQSIDTQRRQGRDDMMTTSTV